MMIIHKEKQLKSKYICFYALFITVFLVSCATSPEIFRPEEKKEEILPVNEQIRESDAIKKPDEAAMAEDESRSLDIFSEILDLSYSSEGRQAVLPKMEALYEKIITEYPDAPLAQESYWKLITMYLEDYSPPELDKAEKRYNEFKARYPDSWLRSIIEDSLAKGYYQNGQWDLLLELSAPSYDDYIEKGKQPRASILFMYAEAGLHLGQVSNAKKAYEIVAELFPLYREGKKSVSILQEMEKKEQEKSSP